MMIASTNEENDMQQVTLKPGDYVATEGVTKNDYYAVARAFMNAGANDLGKAQWFRVEYRKHLCRLGWDSQDNVMWASGGWVEGFGRQLTIDQVLNATNAGGKEADAKEWTPARPFDGGDGEWGQREGDYYITRSYKDGELIITAYRVLGDTEKETDMHITDKLCKARRERDEAQARYEQALAEHRETYPWLLIEERKQPEPADDMNNPANWRAGDWLECKRDAGDLTEGKLYQALGMGRDNNPIIDDDVDKHVSRDSIYFRFHSRP